MRLYLSSFRLGDHPQALLDLLDSPGRTAVIANANDLSPSERRAMHVENEIGALRGLGLDPFELDLRQYFGKSEALRLVLAECNLVWVRGGNTFVLRRAFRQSGFDEMIKELLAEDAIVYGGYSAGVAVLSPSLEGTELVDDPHATPEGYEPGIVWEGLNLIPFAFCPHYRSDHPESAAVEDEVQRYIDTQKLFVALRDGQAIVVRDGRRWTVP